MKFVHSIWFLVLLSCATVCAADGSAETKITFEEHIKPIFREHCTTCHSESEKESDLALDTFAGTLAGGSSGAVIVEGKADNSRLYKLLTHVERPFMPPDQDPLAKEQLELVKLWIEQGTPENSGSKIKRSNSAAAAMLSTATLGKPDGPPPMPESMLSQPVRETERSAAVAAIAASPWAPLVVIGGQQQVSCYHMETGALLGVIPFPEGEPQSLSFTRDGKQLLIGGGKHSHSGCAVLVDIVSGQRIAKVGDELDIVLAADISPDKQRIALAGPSKIIRIFDTSSGELVVEMKKHTDWIFTLRYSPDGVLLATGDRSNGLIVWEAETGRVYSELKGHTGEVRSLDFRADSNVLASASLDGNVKLWDLIESKEIKSWAAHGGGVSSVAFALNGLLATAGADARVKVWNGNGEMQKEFQGLGEAALEVALSGDAGFVAAGDWNGKVQLWSVADPAKTKILAANPPSIKKRIEHTQVELAAIQTEMLAVEQATHMASELAMNSQTQLTSAQQSVDTMNAQLTMATSATQTLTVELTQLDKRIEQLEAELLAARAQRQELGLKSEQSQTQVTALTAQSQTAAEALIAAKATHAKHLEAAQATTAQRVATAARLAAAQEAVDKALADQAALDKRAAELEQLQQQTAAAVQALVAQVNSAEQQEQSQQAASEKLTAELQTLTDQLSLLQMRVAEATQAQQQSKQNLNKQTSQTKELENQLQAAEQAALEAQAQQRLFREVYK